MVITGGMRDVIGKSAFLTIVTMCPDGMPHPIIVGKGTVEGDSITVGVYGMAVTQENLKKNDRAMILCAEKGEAGAKGYRFTGNAKVEGKQFVFTAAKADALI
jgi:hypothetical protein